MVILIVYGNHIETTMLPAGSVLQAGRRGVCLPNSNGLIQLRWLNFQHKQVNRGNSQLQQASKKSESQSFSCFTVFSHHQYPGKPSLLHVLAVPRTVSGINTSALAKNRKPGNVKDEGQSHVPFTTNSPNAGENETHGQPLHRFGSSHQLEQAARRFDARQDCNENAANATTRPTNYQYKVDMASAHHMDAYNHMPSVNLSGLMQSQVPEPYGKTPTHMNMPGGGNRREEKYIQGRLSDMTGKREFSTYSPRRASYKLDEHGNETYNTENLERMLNDPCPQGIQGEDCEQFKLWLSNCLQYGQLPECEQLANDSLFCDPLQHCGGQRYIAGRKTLAQLFHEYDIDIMKAAAKGSTPQ